MEIRESENHVEEGNENLISMPARMAHTIYQSDLEELLLRSQRLNEARDRYCQLRDYIQCALKLGARLEPGLHEAILSRIEPRPYSAVPKPYWKLTVR